MNMGTLSAEVIFFTAVVSIAVFSILGCWVAIEKNRPIGEGLILGGVFGPYGVLIEALLPNKPE